MPTRPPADEKRKRADPETPDYRGGIFDQVDVAALTSFSACLLLFILVIVGLRNVDYSPLEKPSLEAISERVSKIIMPLKPPGKAASRTGPPRASGPGKRAGPGAGKADASALARIERSRSTVARQITRVQERITKAAVLSILSGKGPGTAGHSVGRGPGAKGADRFAGFGDLDSRLGSIEGLTKYDGKKGDVNRAGAPPEMTRGDEVGTAGDAEKLMEGFAKAKAAVARKIGVAGLERPIAVDRSARFTGNRSPSDVAAFIARKQGMVSLLYEERLKTNPTLEGKITILMVIEEDGTVSEASVVRSESTLDDPEFELELLRRIKRWIFPPSAGGPVQMKSPFLFRPA
jgi:TonB family protein